MINKHQQFIIDILGTKTEDWTNTSIFIPAMGVLNLNAEPIWLLITENGNLICRNSFTDRNENISLYTVSKILKLRNFR